VEQSALVVLRRECRHGENCDACHTCHRKKHLWEIMRQSGIICNATGGEGECSEAQCSAGQCRIVQDRGGPCRTIQCRTVQDSAGYCRIVQDNTVEYSEAP
jgi:hypothetical protein